MSDEIHQTSIIYISALRETPCAVNRSTPVTKDELQWTLEKARDVALVQVLMQKVAYASRITF
jgi:hypothetical protein